jgi:hypothetical protein
MIRAINSLPGGWEVAAYTALAWGLIVALTFLVRYMWNLPWRSTEEGRHIVAFTASVAAFYLLYVVQSLIRDWWFRPYLLVILLFALTANLTWRWIILEKHLAARRRTRRAAREDA